jgi:3-oxoadipate enol-lactonase
MPFTAASFGVMHYQVTGAKTAPAIVFANSLGTDLRIWDETVDALAPAFRCIRYDKRGHGLSSVPPAPYRLEDLAGDLLALADHLELQHFVLVGVSVGGLIAQRFALDHPNRLSGLVLCDTAAKIGDAKSWTERIDSVTGGGMAAIVDAVLLRWFPTSIRGGREIEIAGWRNLLLSCPVEGYIGTCAALRDADLTAEIEGIAMPTLVIVGAQDEATPVPLVRATADRMSEARLEVIEQAGHIPSIDQPRVMARLISDYLTEVGHA